VRRAAVGAPRMHGGLPEAGDGINIDVRVTRCRPGAPTRATRRRRAPFTGLKRRFARAFAAVRALEWFLRQWPPKRVAAAGRAARRTVPERAARATLRVDP